MNNITINPKGMSNNVEWQNKQTRIAPFEGAMTKVEFKTNTGVLLLITIQRNNGEISFGSVAYDTQNNKVGRIDQRGLLYARVNNNAGKLTVK